MTKIPRMLFIKLVTISITLIVVGSALLYLTKHNNQDTITAITGNEIANQIALNWSENATLVHVHPIGDNIVNGYSNGWGFAYWNGLNENNSELLISIWTHKEPYTRLTNRSPDELPIYDWNVDSDKAYNIAMKNEKIKSFMTHSPTLDSFFLASPAPTGNSVWYIYWSYNAGIDDPKWAQIQIDANTGEVLYVDVDT